jgi:predicted RNase H-like HicB family nuclease
MKYFTVSTAKPKLGRLLDGVLKSGIPVVIRRGGRFVQISEYVVPHPLPCSLSDSGAVNEDTPNGRPTRLHFKINLFKSKEGWAASCPDLAGCNSQGSSRIEAMKNIKNAIRLWLEVEAEERGLKRVGQEDVLV